MDNKKKGIGLFIAATLVMSVAIIGVTAEETPINVYIENPDAIASSGGTVYWSMEPDSITLYIPPGQSRDIVVTITNDPSSTENLDWQMMEFGYYYGKYGDFDFKEPPDISPGDSWTGPIGTFYVNQTTPLGTVCTLPECKECFAPLDGVPDKDCVYVTVIAGPQPQVPTLTPIGLIALVGLLSVIAAVSIRTNIRKKRK